MTDERIMQLPAHTRASTVDGSSAPKREIYFSFSSENPVQRRYGKEVLSHKPGSLITERLDRGAVPFLLNHNHEQVLGKVLSYSLGLGKNYAVARIFRSPEGDQYLRDVQDGRDGISCAYIIHSMELTEGEPNGDNNIYTVTRYEILEISAVACAADTTVGIGRMSDALFECRVLTPTPAYATRSIEQQELDHIRREWSLERQAEEERLRQRNERLERIQFYWDPAAASR